MNRFWGFLNNRKRVIGGLLVVLFLILGTTLINLLQNKGIEASGSSSLTIEEGQGALKFDGIDDYVDVYPDFVMGEYGEWSFSMWVYSNNYVTRQTLLSRRYPCNNNYHFNIYIQNRRIYLGYRSNLESASASTYSDAVLEDGQWYHMVWIRKWGEASTKLYLNGQLMSIVGDSSLKGTTSGSSLPIIMGSQWSVDVCYVEPLLPGELRYFFNGSISGVHLYNRLLSEDEVMSLYRGEQLIAGPFVGWDMEDRLGEIVDDVSTHGYDGTIHGAEWSSRWRGQMSGLVAQSSGLTINSGQVQGEITSPIYDLSLAGVSGGSQIIWEAETPLGKALEFDGNGYVEVAEDSSLGPSQITISTWIKFPSSALGTQLRFIGKHETGFKGYEAAKGANNRIQWWPANGSDWNLLESNSTLLPDRWYHIVLISHPDYRKIYIDGTEDISAGGIGDIVPSPNRNLIIGGSSSKGYLWNGHIDDVRIYNYALDEGEIQEIMSGEATGAESGLMGYWKFNESSGSTAFDSSGNGNNGTIFEATRVNSIQSSVQVETNLSLNGGSTWQGWQSVTNGETIPGAVSGANLSNARLQTRQVLTTEKEGVNPVLGSLTMQIWGFGDPNVNGWAWSENIGWISFSNVAAGTEVPYGLHINPETMKLSGYIWSENIGWITFHRSVAGDPPSGNPCSEDPDCMAVLDPETFEISGWARALNYGDGWTGWISLAGTASDSSPYGVSIDPDSGIFDGWAWGSGLIGWISFNSDNEVPGTPEYYVYTTMDIGPKVDNLSHTWNYCLDTLHPILDWGVSKDSYGYFIEIYQDAGLSQLIYQYESGITGATSHIPSYDAGTCHPGDDGYQNTGICNLEYGSNQYWWRIKARSAGDLYGAWSEPAAFIVENNHHWPEPDYIYDPDPVRAKQVSQFIDQSQPYGESEIESWYWTVDGIEGIDYNFVSAQRIPIVEGLAMHLDASMISGLEDGEKISQWDDMSGRGNHATNSDPATQPIFKEDPVSKKPMVGFAQNIDRSDPRHLDSVLSSNHDPNEGPSVFAVVLIPDNIPDGTRVGNVWGSYPTAPNYNLELHALGKTRWYWNQGEKDVYGSTDIRMGELAVISYHRDAVNGKLQTYINGVLDLDHDGAGTNTIYGQNWRLGRDYRSGNGIALIGNIAEFIVYERSLPSDEREAVEQYLMDKWLTEGDLEETGPESRNPYIMFRLEGEYDVTLEVTDSSGYGPCAITKRINVEEAADLEWREVSPTDE